MDRTIRLDSNGNDITCMKVFDALMYPCDACNIEDCEDREVYEFSLKKKSDKTKIL